MKANVLVLLRQSKLAELVGRIKTDPQYAESDVALAYLETQGRDIANFHPSTLGGVELVNVEDLSWKREDDFATAVRIHHPLASLPRSVLVDSRFLSSLVIRYYLRGLSYRWQESLKTSRVDNRFATEWVCSTVSQSTVLRHVVGRLVLPTRVLFDADPKHAEEMLSEYYSHQDYSRVFSSKAARYDAVWTSILTYVMQNQTSFADSKESKVRYLFRRLNLTAARIPISQCPRTELIRMYDEWMLSYES